MFSVTISVKPGVSLSATALQDGKPFADQVTNWYGAPDSDLAELKTIVAAEAAKCRVKLARSMDVWSAGNLTIQDVLEVEETLHAIQAQLLKFGKDKAKAKAGK
jgi:hypothetical protein